MKRKMFFILVFLVLALASCSPVSVGLSSDAESEIKQVVEPTVVDINQITSEESENTENVEAPAPRTRNSEAKLVHDVSFDLSKRLGLDISEVTKIDIRKIIWPSSALGCPADGVAYIEAEIEGFQITLEAQGEEYIYHTNGFETFIWCDEGTPVEAVDN